MTAYRTLVIGLGVAVMVAGSALAQTPAPHPLPVPVKPLAAGEATQCRAIAETLRDREYEQMNSLIIRIERSLNLSVEALNTVQKQVTASEVSIKTHEGYAERLAFAAAPGDSVKSLIGKEDSDALKVRLSGCLERVPPVVPSKPAMAKN